MNSRYYYSFLGAHPACTPVAGSMESDEYPLIVNCAGNYITAQPFVTDVLAGRKDFYLLYITDGGMDVYIDSDKLPVKSGDIIIFPPKYHYKYVYDAAAPLSYLWVHFTGSYADRLLSECISDKLPCILSTCGDNKIIAIFRKIFDIYDAGGTFQKQELSCALESLIVSAAVAVRSAEENRSLELSMRYIHSAFNTDIRIPELAKLESISNSRFISLFKSRTGMTPSEYITNLRMNTACELLLTTDKSVKEVGICVGYDDAHFFSRVFKKHFGISPNLYKTSVKR